MSNGIPYANSSRKSAATLILVSVHGVLWIAFLVGLFRMVPQYERTLRDFNMKLPTSTEFVMAMSRWLSNHVWFASPLVVFGLIVDGFVYQQLRGSGARRLSTLWAVFLTLASVLAIVWTLFSLLLPLWALPVGLSK